VVSWRGGAPPSRGAFWRLQPRRQTHRHLSQNRRADSVQLSYKPAARSRNPGKSDPNGFGNSLAEGALYPFGFGLSTRRLNMLILKISPATIPTNGEVTVTCEIKNTGDRAAMNGTALFSPGNQQRHDLRDEPVRFRARVTAAGRNQDRGPLSCRLGPGIDQPQRTARR